MTVQNSDAFLLSRNGEAYQASFADLSAALPQPVWGRAAADGTELSMRGASVSRRSTGIYKVHLDQARADADFPVIVTLETERDTSNCTIAALQIRSTVLRIIITEQTSDGSFGTPRDVGFSFFIPA